MSALVPNRPSARGREMGRELARLADVAEAKLRKYVPDLPERCTSCAFRAETLPNGCEDTVMDALKAVVEGDLFLCHMKRDAEGNPAEPCAGWLYSVGSGPSGVAVPWEYSHRDAEREALAAIDTEGALDAAP